MTPGSRVYVAGSNTLVGRALIKRLGSDGYATVGVGDEEPDLTERGAVEQFFGATKPEFVFVAAGESAGIAGNQRRPADLMLDNLLIASHVVPAAWRSGTKKLIYLSSSCTYPKRAPQPLQPSALWSGPLERSSAAYATAKLAGLELCEAYRRQHQAAFVTAIAADVYGPGDDFSPETSHVVAALIRRIHEAQQTGAPEVKIWGSGTPQREFIYVDDLADACIFVMRQYQRLEPINLGTGEFTSIAALAELIRNIIGYGGELVFDRSRPDGMPFKGLDSSVLRSLGWRPTSTLRRGLQNTCEWFAANVLRPA